MGHWNSIERLLGWLCEDLATLTQRQPAEGSDKELASAGGSVSASASSHWFTLVTKSPFIGHKFQFSFSQSPWIPNSTTCSSVRQMLEARPLGSTSRHQEHADERALIAFQEPLGSAHSVKLIQVCRITERSFDSVENAL